MEFNDRTKLNLKYYSTDSVTRVRIFCDRRFLVNLKFPPLKSCWKWMSKNEIFLFHLLRVWEIPYSRVSTYITVLQIYQFSITTAWENGFLQNVPSYILLMNSLITNIIHEKNFSVILDLTNPPPPAQPKIMHLPYIVLNIMHWCIIIVPSMVKMKIYQQFRNFKSLLSCLAISDYREIGFVYNGITNSVTWDKLDS